MEQGLCVTFFGGFTVSCPGGKRVVSERERASQRLWSFLEYLCAFHQNGVGQEELIGAIWEEGEEAADPVGALKTTLHRARAILEELGFPDGKQVLLYRRGRYFWAPELELCTDAEELEALYTAFSAEPDKALSAVLEFLPRYQGDFLPNAAGAAWTLPLRTYYHTRYLRLSCGAANRLWELGRLDEAIGVCRQAATLDPYDEQCQLLLMRLFHASGATQTALQHYSQLSKLYMDQLGVAPSPELVAFYQEIARIDTSVELDLRIIRRQLLEEEPAGGALICEYAVFRDIYRLMARGMYRSGRVVQLCLLTVLERDGGCPEAKRSAAAMAELERTCLSRLRSEDVAARLNANQYLLLLPTASYENAERVLRRGLDAFRNTLLGRTVAVRTSLLPVLPSRETASRGTPARELPPRAEWREI